MPSQPLNVLLIHTDQQRYDSLGCTGNPHAETPNLDALASSGTVFHRHISTNSVCMPSRASLLTGRYPSGHGVWINGVPLPRRDYVQTTEQARTLAERRGDARMPSHVPTLADGLAAEGYRTAAIGKLHLTPTRSSARRGYEESMALWREREMRDWHGPYYGFARVEMTLGHGERVGGHYRCWLEEQHPEVARELDRGARHEPPFQALPQLHAGVLPVEAHHSTWIGRRAQAYLRDRTGERPFFLFLGFPDPHPSYCPPRELAEQFAGGDALPSSALTERRGARVSAWRSLQEDQTKSLGAKGLGEEAIHLLRRYTDAQVHLIDRAVGGVLETLEQTGQAGRTVVLFTSDHGDFLGDHGLVTKANLCCDALDHVPFLLRAPGADLPAETPLPMSNADIVPTVCELLGVEPPPGVQGRSILRPVRSGRAEPVFVQCYDWDPARHNLSVYDERLRLTVFPATGERELHDHRQDPQERVNLGGDPAWRDEQQRLYRTLLEAHCRLDNPSLGRVSVF